MTLPATGPISIGDMNVELGLPRTSQLNLGNALVRTIEGIPTGAIGMGGARGKAYVIAGNALITSGTSYTLPVTSGPSINVLVIGGGGGGGGGSGRTFASGYYVGGGGGSSGGASYALNIPVTPGQKVTFQVGGGGTAGSVRDGIYSSGSGGGPGGDSFFKVNNVAYAYAYGGKGGANSPTGTGAAYATATAIGIDPYHTAGSPAGSPGLNAGATAYLEAVTANTKGGPGGKGLLITLATTDPSYLAPHSSLGNFGVGYPENSGTFGVAGTGYGAGGTGGGCAQSDVYNYNNIIATTGNGGAVFIWWGY